MALPQSFSYHDQARNPQRPILQWVFSIGNDLFSVGGLRNSCLFLAPLNYSVHKILQCWTQVDIIRVLAQNWFSLILQEFMLELCEVAPRPETWGGVEVVGGGQADTGPALQGLKVWIGKPEGMMEVAGGWCCGNSR